MTTKFDINTEVSFTKNGHATDASICARYVGNQLMLLACTLTESKYFKTMTGALSS